MRRRTGCADAGVLKAKYIDILFAKFEESCDTTRRATLQMLADLEPREFAKILGDFIQNMPKTLLECQIFLDKWIWLDGRLLAEYADRIVLMLNDDCLSVRYATLCTLGKLEPDVLAKYADCISLRLGDDDFDVYREALCTLALLEQGQLAMYAERIIPTLENENCNLRYEALRTLSKLEPEVLARYVANITPMLNDEDDDVGDVSLETLETVPLLSLVPFRTVLIPPSEVGCG